MEKVSPVESKNLIKEFVNFIKRCAHFTHTLI